MLKNLGKDELKLLTKVFNKARSEINIPEDSDVGTILPIFKKGGHSELTISVSQSVLINFRKTFEQNN